MKKIGIIGGMSWESTIEYYRIINSEINKRLGGVHSASMFIESYDFQEIEELQHKGEWTKMAEILSQTAVKLEKCGADFLLIATNTMHKVAPHKILIELFNFNTISSRKYDMAIPQRPLTPCAALVAHAGLRRKKGRPLSSFARKVVK